MLRPLGVGELLDAAIKIYRSRAKAMLLAAAVLTVPAVVLQTLVGLSAGSPEQLTRTDSETGLLVPDGQAMAVYFGGLLVSTVILIVANNIALAGTTRLSMGVYLREDVGWKESLRYAGRRFWPLMAVLAISAIGLIVGFFLCIAPGLWLQGIWAVAVPALLVEDIGARASLRRSQDLVRGRFWPVLGTVLLGSLLTSIVQGVLTGPILLLQLAGVSFAATTIMNGIAQLIGVTITTPFMAALGAVLYVDLRVRKEGFDLELMARTVGTDAAAVPSTSPVAQAFPTQAFPAPPAPPTGWPAAGPPGGPAPPQPPWPGPMSTGG